MSDHRVGISVEQFCACDQSCGCFSGLQSKSYSPVAPLTTALFLSQTWLRKGHPVMHKCAHSLSFLCVHDSRVSTVVTGGVVTGTRVVTCFHLVTEQSIGGLLSETCHSSLGSERMCISLEKKLARSGKVHLRTSDRGGVESRHVTWSRRAHTEEFDGNPPRHV